jgi:hypothetical protein
MVPILHKKKDNSNVTPVEIQKAHLPPKGKFHHGINIRRETTYAIFVDYT